MYSRIVPGRLDRRRSGQRAAFNGNLASLFPGAYQVLQTDLGLTLGSTLLANAGNTSTTVQTFTGGFSGPPVPVWTKATNTLAIGAGAQFNIYYDGTGTTPAMTGVTPAIATPVALTGAAAGLSITWAAGTSVTNDIWKATCAALADQSGNGAAAVQANPAKQPLIGPGLNGKVELLSDGVDDYLTTAALALPVGAMLYMVFKYRGIGGYITDGPTSDHQMLFANGGNTSMYNGVILAGVGAFGGAGIYGRVAAVYNGASSSIKVGSNGLVSGDAGSVAQAAGRNIFISGALTVPSFLGLLALIWAPVQSTAAADAAINSAAGYGVGSIVA